MGRKLEYLVISLIFLIGLGYTNLPTVSNSGNQFATQIDNRFSGILPVNPLLDTGTVIQGNIAGKAGVTTDQIGTTQALAQINHEVCADGYGAKGDGSTDDRAAIQAAVDACGTASNAGIGCTVHLNCTSGRTTSPVYIINSRGVGGQGLVLDWNNMVFDGNGATLQAGTGVSGTLDVVMMGGGPTNGRCFEGSPTYSVTTGSAVKGSRILTMTTAGQETQFSAGTQIYIAASAGNVNDSGQNIVDFVDTSAHTLHLQYALGRTYTPTPAIVPEDGVVSGHTCVTSDITLRNVILNAPSGTNSRALAMFNTRDFLIENTTMYMDSIAGAGDSPTNIANWRGVFRNNVWEGRCSQVLDLASRGNGHIRVEGGTYIIRDADGASCGGGPLTGTGIGEGVEDITWDGVKIINYAGCTQGDMGITTGTGAQGPIKIINSEVQLTNVNNNTLSAGIGLSSGLGTDVTVVGNTVKMANGRVGFYMRGNDSYNVHGNHFYALTALSTLYCAILDGTPGIFSGNVCSMAGQSTGINVSGAAAGSTVSGNIFTNSATGGSYPIVLDNASNPSPDTTVIGNTDLTPSNYSNSSVGMVGFVGTHANARIIGNSPKGSFGDQ